MSRHCPISRQIDDHLARLDREDERGEAIAALVDQYLDDPRICRRADDWNEGKFDSEHYTAVERALADFGSYSRYQLAAIIEGRKVPAHPEQLIRAIERLHELALMHGKARRARLELMAINQVDTGEAA